MGIFDGVLIASDWDGTLFCDDTIPERAREATNYFMDNGGRFALTSGRDATFLSEKKHLIKPNTYCICYGGALVCDIESGEVLRRGYLDRGAVEAIDRILSSGVDIVRINVFCDGGIRHYTPDEYYEFGKSETLTADIYKVTFNCRDSEGGERLRDITEDFGYTEYTFRRSFAPYLEIMQTEYTKGAAALFLKEKLGARVLVGMGDYENDIPLFEKCDISFAVANAVDSLKSIATYVTKATVRESAAAEIIEILEKLIKAGKI